MANPIRGEAPLVVDGTRYTLRLSANEIVALEAAMELGITQIAAKLADGAQMRLGDWRLVLHAALRAHHADIDEDGAGDLITAAGVPAVIAALGQAMSSAFPAPEDARPSPAARSGGTGKAS